MVSISENDQIVIRSLENFEVLKKFYISKKSNNRLIKAFFTEFDTRLIIIFESKIVEIEQICRLGKFD